MISGTPECGKKGNPWKIEKVGTQVPVTRGAVNHGPGPPRGRVHTLPFLKHCSPVQCPHVAETSQTARCTLVPVLAVNRIARVLVVPILGNNIRGVDQIAFREPEIIFRTICLESDQILDPISRSSMREDFFNLKFFMVIDQVRALLDISRADFRRSSDIGLEVLDVLDGGDPVKTWWYFDFDCVRASDLEDLERPQPAWGELVTWELEVVVFSREEYQVASNKCGWFSFLCPFVCNFPLTFRM
eukprot:2263379-Rhodomonas_salina.1